MRAHLFVYWIVMTGETEDRRMLTVESLHRTRKKFSYKQTKNK